MDFLLVGLRHFLASKGAEKLSGQVKDINDLKMPQTFVNTRPMHIRAESTSLFEFESVCLIFYLSPTRCIRLARTIYSRRTIASF